MYGKKSEKGVTFIELLVSGLILSLVIGGMLQAYQYHLQLSEIALETSVALGDASDILESIGGTPFSSVPVNFPHGVVDGPAGNKYSGRIGGYALVNETITVTYIDASADPLEIIVTVTWNGPRNRPLQVALSTMKTE